MSAQPKTVAESAYCELLVMPMPKTERDFRRAIVMAALVGRQLEADFAADASWQSAPPDKPGVWDARCYETEFEPLRVTILQRTDGLWVDDPGLGIYPLDRYHAGLPGIRWRLATQF